MWRSTSKNGMLTPGRRPASNLDLFASRETPSGYFEAVDAASSTDQPLPVRYADENESAELDAVLANVNRLLESLGTDFDSSPWNDVTPPETSADSNEPNDVRQRARRIDDLRAKPTSEYRRANGMECHPGAGKQGLADKAPRDGERAESPAYSGRQSRSLECRDEISKHEFQPIATGDGSRLLADTNSHAAHKTRPTLSPVNRTLVKSRSQGALDVGQLSVAGILGYEIDERLNKPVVVKRGSPVISRHRSLQENLQLGEKALDDNSSAILSGNEKEITDDKVKTWLTKQQGASTGSIRRHKRFSSLTQSNPFKFAQQFIPGKRKLAVAKSAPAQQADQAEPQSPKQNEPRSEAQPKKKPTPISKSLFSNFRRSVSLEEPHNNHKSILRSSNAPNSHSANGQRKKQTSFKVYSFGNLDPADGDGSTVGQGQRTRKKMDQLSGEDPYKEEQQRLKKVSVTSAGSEPANSQYFTFEEYPEMPVRRATLDSAQRPAKPQPSLRTHTSFSSGGFETLKPRFPLTVEKQERVYSSLPRETSRGLKKQNPGIGARSPGPMTATVSGESGASSEDSLTDWRGSLKVKRNSSDKSLKKQKAVDPSESPDLDPVRVGKRGKINKIRRSLKHVGKAASSPTPESEDMAERTWGPDGNCTWSNMSGRKMQLGSTRLQSLSELECDALQKVAVQRLNESDLNIAVTVPKDESKILNRKISMKKKYGVHLSVRDKNKDKNVDHVFGIPLVEVVENDQLLRLQKSAAFADFTAPSADGKAAVNEEQRTKSHQQQLSQDGSCSGSSCSIASISLQTEGSAANTARPVHRCLKKASSCESLNIQDYSPTDSVFRSPGFDGATEDSAGPSVPLATGTTSASTAARPLKRRGAIAANSLNEIDPYQSQLLEALSLSVSGKTHNHRREKKRSLLPPTMAQVPYVVQKCCDHITKYGLAVTGIFRVAGSKKRVKQLREEFDRGVDVTIDEDYNPHDVATLLKEFFRDLPEAILTRELYHAFIQTTKHPKGERLQALRCLIWLLPLTNRDTLFTLLNFLSVVAAHSEDSVDSTGNKVPGNKMSVTNLATIFGPNILHRYKKSLQTSSENQYQVQSLDRAEESSAVITVVENIITNCTQLFQIVKYDHDQMLRTLNETDPEAVDFLLRRKAANYMREKSKVLTLQSQINGNANNNNNNNNSNNNHLNDGREMAPVSREAVSASEASQSNGLSPPRTPSSMRMSYQQATGHVTVPSPSKLQQEKGSKLKFKRPFLKLSNPPSLSCSDVEEQNESSSSNGSESDEVKRSESYDTVADLEPTKPTVEKPLQCDSKTSVSSGSSLGHSDPLALRSMSFTEDDLHEILQPSGPTRDSPQHGPTAFHQDMNAGRSSDTSSAASVEKLVDGVFVVDSLSSHANEKDEHRDKDLSDSGISMETFAYSPQKLDHEVAQVVKRRGGFSARQRGGSQTSVGVDDQQQRDNAKQSVSNSSLESNKGTGSMSKGSQAKDSHYVSQCKVTFTPSKDTKGKLHAEGVHPHLSVNSRRTSQVLLLCDGAKQNRNNMADIPILDANHIRSAEKLDPTDTERNKSLPKRDQRTFNRSGKAESPTKTTLPNSLSPKLHRQYGARRDEAANEPRRRVRTRNPAESKTGPDPEPSTVVHVRRRARATERHVKKDAQAPSQSKPPSSYERIADCSKGDVQAADKTAHRRRGRRYSKDDLSIGVKDVAGSRWTSSGYLPQCLDDPPSLEQAARLRTRQTPRNLDQSKLPETWV